MSEKLQFLKAFSNNLFGKITVRSVQNSHIWLMGVFLVVIVAAAVMNVPTWIIICLILILITLTLYYMYRDNYFMRNHPEYLRSETYQLHKQQLEMMGSQAKEVSAQTIEEQPLVEKPTTSTAKRKIQEGSSK